MKLSGSFLPIVVAMVFLGGPPAALIGVVTILVGWLSRGTPPHYLLNNLLSFVTFPMVSGLAFHWVTTGAGIYRLSAGLLRSAFSRSSCSPWRSTSR